jgi:WXG100 family type VII secretion target
MADRTQATSADLRTTRTEILHMDEETSGELSKLKASAMSLRSDNWRSTLSGKSFDETMAQWDQDAAAMRRALQDIAQLMKTTADRYDNVEHDNVNAVRIQSGDGRSYDLGR